MKLPAKPTVEKLTSSGAVDAGLVNLGRIISKIFDVPEHMTFPVLRDEVAKIRAETHVGHCRLVRAPFFDWKAFEQDEALAVQYLIAHTAEEALQLWKLELVLESRLETLAYQSDELTYFRDAGKGSIPGHERICSFAQLCNLVLTEVVRPLLRPINILVCCPSSRASDLLRKRIVRPNLVEIRRNLSAGLDPIGKDLWIGVVVCEEFGLPPRSCERLCECWCHCY